MPYSPDPRIRALAPLILPYIGYPDDHPLCVAVGAKELTAACESIAEELIAESEDSRPDVPSAAELNKGRKW